MESMGRSSLAPLQEYLLQGSVLESHRDVLLHRLNGLCDTVDTGPEKFHDHEIVLQLSKSQSQSQLKSESQVSNLYFYFFFFVPWWSCVK